MTAYDLEFHPELVAQSAWIAPSADVIGRVRIGEEASVWYGAVVRGDAEEIVIGDGSNVQDLCLLHADVGVPCSLGRRVTLGHGAIVHGAYVEDDVLIGMRATILNHARIGTGSLVAAGSLVPEGMDVPPGWLVWGTPAELVRPIDETLRERIVHAAEHYRELTRQLVGATQGNDAGTKAGLPRMSAAKRVDRSRSANGSGLAKSASRTGSRRGERA